MSVTLVLGGARSGKSRYAESLLRGHPSVTYVAPGDVPDGSDPEWAERISLHQARRPPEWSTLETTDLAAVIRAAQHPVLIDCLSTWLTHLIDDIDAWQDRERAASHLEKETARLLDALRLGHGRRRPGHQRGGLLGRAEHLVGPDVPRRPGPAQRRGQRRQ